MSPTRTRLFVLIAILCETAHSATPVPRRGQPWRPPVDPQQAGDTVGRDLNMPLLGSIGHVGMWDGSQVVEALSDGGNAIRLNSLSDFKSRTSYWGAVFPRIPDYTVYDCYAARCTNYLLAPKGQVVGTPARSALTRFAYQQYLLGADYTMSATFRYAYPATLYEPSPTRGMYRCDTLVVGIFLRLTPAGNPLQSRYGATDPVFGARVEALYGSVPTPRSVFNTLSTWS